MILKLFHRFNANFGAMGNQFLPIAPSQMIHGHLYDAEVSTLIVHPDIKHACPMNHVVFHILTTGFHYVKFAFTIAIEKANFAGDHTLDFHQNILMILRCADP